MLSEAALERALAGAFPVPLRLRVATDLVDPASLTPPERVWFASVDATPRRDSWLRGRAALKRVRLTCGEEDSDTAGLRFPHPRYSLTHSGAWAIAVGAPGRGLAGLGVDFETRRLTGPDAARWLSAAGYFLDEVERAWVAGLAPAAQGPDLVRLWTVKEALFKTDPDNAGRALAEYVSETPGAPGGRARLANGGAAVYRSWALPEGVLTVAVAEGGDAC